MGYMVSIWINDNIWIVTWSIHAWIKWDKWKIAMDSKTN